MEVTLSQLAERWNNVVWGMDPYKGGDVPLLKIAEEDFEALEVLVTCIRQKNDTICTSTAPPSTLYFHVGGHGSRKVLRRNRWISETTRFFFVLSSHIFSIPGTTGLVAPTLAASSAVCFVATRFSGGPASCAGHDGL